MLEGGMEEGGVWWFRKEGGVIRTRLGGCIRCRWCGRIFAGREAPLGTGG